MKSRNSTQKAKFGQKSKFFSKVIPSWNVQLIPNLDNIFDFDEIFLFLTKI